MRGDASLVDAVSGRTDALKIVENMMRVDIVEDFFNVTFIVDISSGKSRISANVRNISNPLQPVHHTLAQGPSVVSSLSPYNKSYYSRPAHVYELILLFAWILFWLWVMLVRFVPHQPQQMDMLNERLINTHGIHVINTYREIRLHTSSNYNEDEI